MTSDQNHDFAGGNVLAHDNAAGLLVIIRNLIIIHLRGECTILNQDARATHGVKHGIREHGIHASTVRVHAHKPALGEPDGPEIGGRVGLNGSAMPDSFPIPTLFSLGLCHDDFVSVLDFRRREDALFDFAVGRVVVCQTQLHEDRLTTAVNVPFVDDEILSRRIRVVSFLSPHVSGAIVRAVFLRSTLQVVQCLVALSHDTVVSVHADVHTVDAVVDSLIEALTLYNRGDRRHCGNRRAAIVAGDEVRVIRGQRLRGLRPIRGRGRKRFMMVVHFYTSQYNKVGTQTGIIRLLPILYHRDVKKSTMSFLQQSLCAVVRYRSRQRS